MYAERDTVTGVRTCPHHERREDRKSFSPKGANGQMPFERLSKKSVRIRGIDLARQILRGEGSRQAGFMAELANLLTKRGHEPVLFQEGESHRKLRSATARFFAPKVVGTRYRQLMVEQSRRLVDHLRSHRQTSLDAMSMELSVAITAEIVGLANSDVVGLTDRLRSFFDDKYRQSPGKLAIILSLIVSSYRMLRFYLYDVRPAIKSRRVERREDIISHLIDQGYTNREILTECITYGAAGVSTTRELIVMAAWHLFEDPDLKARFLEGDETGRIAILEEILRLEPVVGVLYRRAEQDLVLDNAGHKENISTGTLLAIDVRAVNSDPAVAGRCPHHLDPDREKGGQKWPDSLMSFGDGPHRCPGAPVALQESAIFLDHLLRVPGVRLAQIPRMTSNAVVESYELRGAVVACD
jgi:cytochrome P450